MKLPVSSAKAQPMTPLRAICENPRGQPPPSRKRLLVARVQQRRPLERRRPRTSTTAPSRCVSFFNTMATPTPTDHCSSYQGRSGVEAEEGNHSQDQDRASAGRYNAFRCSCQWHRQRGGRGRNLGLVASRLPTKSCIGSKLSSPTIFRTFDLWFLGLPSYTRDVSETGLSRRCVVARRDDDQSVVKFTTNSTDYRDDFPKFCASHSPVTLLRSWRAANFAAGLYLLAGSFTSLCALPLS